MTVSRPTDCDGSWLDVADRHRNSLARSAPAIDPHELEGAAVRAPISKASCGGQPGGATAALAVAGITRANG